LRQQSEKCNQFLAEGERWTIIYLWTPKSQVFKAYTNLTGTPEFASHVGHGSINQMDLLPEKHVSHLPKILENLRIPCDAIYLGIELYDDY